MKKKMIGIISFLITVAVFVGILKVMNWLPMMMDQNTVREYPSVEAVSSSLGISDIYVPSYFPEQLGWPPAEILAQKKPFEAVVMEFGRSGGDETALVIIQAERPEFAHGAKLQLIDVTENIPYDLDGKTALLEAGTCSDGSPCSRMSWEEDGRHISLTMKSKPIELIRIAESMSR
jgi:hypothetical protein